MVAQLDRLAGMAVRLEKTSQTPAGLLGAAAGGLEAKAGVLVAVISGAKGAVCATKGLSPSLARRVRAVIDAQPEGMERALRSLPGGVVRARGAVGSGLQELDLVLDWLFDQGQPAIINASALDAAGVVILLGKKWPKLAPELFVTAAGLLAPRLPGALACALRATTDEDFRRIFQHSPDMIYFSSRDGRWVDVNPAGVKMLGYDTREELLAVPDIAQAAYMRADDRKPFQKAIEEKGYVKDYEVTFKRKDGTPVEVSITSAVRKRNGEIQGYEGIIKDITARKRAEDLAVREQRRLATLLEVMPVAVFVLDKDHRVTHWNKACEQLTGYSKQRMIGTQEVWRVFKRPEGVSLADVVLMGDEKRLYQEYGEHRLRRSPLSREAWEAEAHFEDLGGQPKDLLFTAAVLRDAEGEVGGAVEAILDTTDLMELERQLAESEQLYRNLVESSLDGIALSDGQGFVFANNPFLHMFGLDDLTQQQGGFLELLTPNSQQEYLMWIKGVDPVADGRRTVAGDSGEVFQGHGVRGDEVFDLELVAVDTRVGGRGARLFTVRDVTERKTMEEQLISSERLAATGKLAFDIAHEINNPLGGIMTYSYLLFEDLGEEHELAPTVSKIIKLTNRCKIIVRGLLDFARQDGMEKAMVNINQVIEEMLTLVEGHVIIRGVEVAMDLDPELPTVYGMRSKLEQVFLNMVINAAEAMEGKGKVSIATSYDPKSKLVSVVFHDNGPGIAEEVLPRLFEPFFTTKGRGRGTGLGLAISHGIVKQHAGRIEVDTKAGEGTTFTVVLPLSAPNTNPMTGQ